MAEIILAEQTFNFTAVDGSATDSYRADLENGPIPLTAGKKYTVVWDGVSYDTFAYGYAYGGVFIGNKSIYEVGSEDTGEPFFIGSVTVNDGSYDAHIIDTLSTASSHTVSVSEADDQSGYLVKYKTMGFLLDENFGLYSWRFVLSQFKASGLIEGETYTVVWDGTKYRTTAKKASIGTASGIFLGNGGLVGLGENNEQPFIFAYIYDNGLNACYTNETSGTHIVSIYREGLISGDDGGTTEGYLLKDQTLAFALEPNSETVYYNEDVEALAITAGNTYTVIWDGDYYECVAKESADGEYTSVLLGNSSIVYETGEDTGEPFVYACIPEYSIANFKTLETDASHVISIYDGIKSDDGSDTEEMTSVNIVLLDRNGNPVTYDGIKTVSFNTADGKIATFTLSAISS